MYVSTLPSEGNSVGISQSIFPEALINTYNMLQLYRPKRINTMKNISLIDETWSKQLMYDNIQWTKLYGENGHGKSIAGDTHECYN